MNRRNWILRILLPTLIILSIVGYHTYDWLRWRERADPSTGVSVELSPAFQVIKMGEMPKCIVTLVNNGSHDVVLVEPGDGSILGWQTPIIKWSRSRWFDWFDGRTCGNTNRLREDAVFVLKPGESRQLDQWVGTPFLPERGLYRVAVQFTNDPELKWTRFPAGEDAPGMMEKVQNSTKMSSVSNHIEILVE
jgi:hypothetical protein